MSDTTAMYPVRYQFTREELRELGLRLAGKAQEVYNARAEKKAAMAAFAARIEESEAEAAALVRKLNELSEIRDVECHVMYNSPRKGIKTIVRMDTGEIDHEETMTPAEMQQSFVFEDKPAKDKPKTQ